MDTCGYVRGMVGEQNFLPPLVDCKILNIIKSCKFLLFFLGSSRILHFSEVLRVLFFAAMLPILIPHSTCTFQYFPWE